MSPLSCPSKQVKEDSHGSLHADDSLVPLVVAGAPASLSLSPPTRTVDIVPLCLAVLGLAPPVPVGAPHGVGAKPALQPA